jgi:endonuclease YncB( thermonuclease family)
MYSAVLVCLVIGISDGDSLNVRCAHAEQRQQVRVHAIDAPERYQPYGDAARSSLSSLCLNAHARIQHLETDGYGRSIARVECRGEDVARHQVAAGMAWVYRHYVSSRHDLVALQAQARSARRGLWADAQPVAPWTWRHRCGLPFNSRPRTPPRSGAPDRAATARQRAC